MKANSSIEVLAENFQINEKAASKFIIRQCNQMGLIGLEISFYLDQKSDDVAFRLEEYALKLIDFIISITEFPFIIDAPSTDSKFKSLRVEKKK